MWWKLESRVSDRVNVPLPIFPPLVTVRLLISYLTPGCGFNWCGFFVNAEALTGKHPAGRSMVSKG